MNKKISAWMLSILLASTVMLNGCNFSLTAKSVPSPQSQSSADIIQSSPEKSPSSADKSTSSQDESQSSPAQILSARSFEQIGMFSERDGWAVIDHKLWKTSDGAQTWADITPKDLHLSKSASDALYVYFSSNQLGWVVDFQNKQTVYYTRDGGAEWSASKLPEPIGREYNASGNIFINFSSSQYGFVLYTSDPAVGQMLKSLFRTKDGGATWSRVGELTAQIASYPTGMTFLNDQVGWITSSYHGQDKPLLYQTKDGGVIWNLQQLPAPSDHSGYADVFPPVFSSAGSPNGVLPVVWHSSSDKTFSVYATQNGGDSWQIQTQKSFNLAYTLYFQVLFHNGNWQTDVWNGWELNTWLNQDKQWTAFKTNIDPAGSANIDFISPQAGYVIIHKQLFKTADFGRTWSKIN